MKIEFNESFLKDLRAVKDKSVLTKGRFQKSHLEKVDKPVVLKLVKV